jgi:hypothetical protein
MTTETGATPIAESATQTAAETAQTETGATPIAPEVQALITAATKRANAEAMQFRQELAAIKAKEKADADAKLEAEKKFEELAAARATELAAMKTQLAEFETYKAKVTAIETARHAELLARLPEANRAALQGFTIDQLEKVVGLLPTAPAQSQGFERQQPQTTATAQPPSVPFAGANSDVQSSLLRILGG